MLLEQVREPLDSWCEGHSPVLQAADVSEEVGPLLLQHRAPQRPASFDSTLAHSAEMSSTPGVEWLKVLVSMEAETPIMLARRPMLARVEGMTPPPNTQKSRANLSFKVPACSWASVLSLLVSRVVKRSSFSVSVGARQ